MPVLIIGTYDENGTPNAMNAAWGGIYDTNLVMVCLADDHKTTENIRKSGEPKFSAQVFCLLVNDKSFDVSNKLVCVALNYCKLDGAC